MNQIYYLEAKKMIDYSSDSSDEQQKYMLNKVLFSISVFLVLLDQITKIIVKGFNLFGYSHQGMFYGETIPVIGNFLQWTFIENPGMAFGITFGAAKVLLSLFSIVASSFLAWYLYKLRKFNPFVQTGIAFVLAGAVGNLIDRVFYGVFYGYESLFYGYVVDFILVDIPDIDFLGFYYTHFPVFNVADSCVTCGVVLLLLFHKHIPTFALLLGRVPAEPEQQPDSEEKEIAGEQAEQSI